MSEKVLVVIADEQIRVYHTAGVETAVVVDGEEVQLPDDWTDLPNLVLHSLPITVRADEIFGAPGENPLEHITPLYTGPSVSELILVTNVPTKLLMREPWCPDCDCNHPVGECEGPGASV